MLNRQVFCKIFLMNLDGGNVTTIHNVRQKNICFAEETYKLKEKSESFDRTLRTVDSGLKERAKETEKNLDEIDTIISELRR